MTSAAGNLPITLPPLRLRRIALPTEHGSWGFLLEPLVAGLAVAFSAAGLWITLFTVGAFLVRQPLKILVLDRRGMRDHLRAVAALKYVTLYSAICAAGLCGAVVTARPSSLLPFFCVLPLAGVQNYYDIFRRSRQLVPEFAGTIAITASVAAIALAGGFTLSASMALWVILVARLVPSILYVRERLILGKGQEGSRVTPIAAQIIAVLAVAILAFYQLASILTVIVMCVLLYRAVSGLSLNRRKMKAKQIGILEIVFGFLVVLSVVLGHVIGW